MVFLEPGLEAPAGLAMGLIDHVDVDLLETAGRARDPSRIRHGTCECGGADALQGAQRQAGFNRVEASRVPPEAAPAPISVWISCR